MAPSDSRPTERPNQVRRDEARVNAGDAVTEYAVEQIAARFRAMATVQTDEQIRRSVEAYITTVARRRKAAKTGRPKRQPVSWRSALVRGLADLLNFFPGEPRDRGCRRARGNPPR